MLTPATENALWDIHEQLCEKELTELRLWGISRQYLVIRPINPANLSSVEDMGKIAAAIRTLAGLGLIAARGSDLPTDQTRAPEVDKVGPGPVRPAETTPANWPRGLTSHFPFKAGRDKEVTIRKDRRMGGGLGN